MYMSLENTTTNNPPEVIYPDYKFCVWLIPENPYWYKINRTIIPHMSIKSHLELADAINLHRALQKDMNHKTINVTVDSNFLISNDNGFTSLEYPLYYSRNNIKPKVFVRGLEKEAMDTIDSGRKRKHSDRLSIRGVSNASAVSAVLSNLVRLGKRYEGWGVITHKQLDNVLELHPRVVDSVSFTRKAFRNIEYILVALH